MTLPQNRLKRAEKTNGKKSNNVNQKSWLLSATVSADSAHKRYVKKMLQAPWQNLPLFQKYQFKEFFFLKYFSVFYEQRISKHTGLGKKNISIKLSCQNRHHGFDGGEKRIYLSGPRFTLAPVFLLVTDLTSAAAFRCPKYKQKSLFISWYHLFSLTSFFTFLQCLILHWNIEVCRQHR